MKCIPFGICLALACSGGAAHGQWARPNGEQSPPPTDLSIVLPSTPAVVNAAKIEPKPVVRNIVVRRPHSIQSGPVNMPSQEVLVMMIRAALTALNQANFTENYSVLRGMTTPTLQARLSATQLGKAFEPLRKQNLDLSPSLVLAPEFTEMPKLVAGSALIVKGIFPSRPLRINFAIEYLPIDGFWMIDQMSVSATRADAPLVSSAEPPPAPAPAPAAATPAATPAPVAAAAPAAAPAPVATPASATADALQFSLPTDRFVPVNYTVDYPQSFVPRGRKTSSKSRPPAAATPSRHGSTAYLQLTSQRNEADAKAVFNSLRARYPKILGDQEAVIRRADLGNKGVYYRAQIGPVNVEQASKQCSDLKAVGAQCFVQYN